jgi:hypothetical protein
MVDPPSQWMTEQEFAAFLERNGQFHERVAENLAQLDPYPEQRYDLATLTVETAEAAKHALMLAEMLRGLRASESAPAGLLDQLEACRDAMWKALNSFTHGGFHPLARLETGYPPRLSYDALRNSNAMVALASQLAAIVTGDRQAMIPVRTLHTEFADCLPIISQ